MTSDLNPQAAEYTPDSPNTKTFQDGYTTIYSIVVASNDYPRENVYELLSTIPGFHEVTHELRSNAIEKNNLIIQTEFPSVRLKLLNDEYNAEKVTDFNDNIVDRVCIALDNVTVGKNQNEVSAISSSQATTHKLVTIQRGKTVFIAGKNIPPPQMSFKDPIDNSDRLWVPKLSDKPNGIKPLALKIIYNEEGKAVGYEHPYKFELDQYHPPKYFLARSEAPPVFPPSLEDTKLTFILNEAQMDKLVNTLQEAKEIAVDLEHHSHRSYQGFTCLIQISTRNEDFIIDALAVREHVHKLNIVFTDPNKLKIFHGADMDVVWLQQDFGVYVVGMFDTHQAARVLGLPVLSLSALLSKYCGVTTNKSLQVTDWRVRPLTEQLVEYARSDTHYLIYIWERMKIDLLNIGNTALVDVFNRSRCVCKQTYQKEVITENSHLSLYKKSDRNFNSQQMAALSMLYQWRDKNARLLDESTQYIFPNFMMLNVAEFLPREIQGVVSICVPMTPFVLENLITIHQMVLSCRQLPLQPSLFPVLRTAAALPQWIPSWTYNFHDFSNYNCFTLGHMSYPEPAEKLTDVNVFKHSYRSRTAHISGLKRHHSCISPFDRYRKYRTLAQVQELKEFEKKEAEIAGLSKGNELIQKGVLQKLQQAKTNVQNEAAAINPYTDPVPGPSKDKTFNQKSNYNNDCKI